jgi:hypothetical protein
MAEQSGLRRPMCDVEAQIDDGYTVDAGKAWRDRDPTESL